MLEIALPLLALAAIFFYCAWFERRRDNLRDAKLLAGFSAGGMALGMLSAMG
mgnify:CR=1 FL=1